MDNQNTIEATNAPNRPGRPAITVKQREEMREKIAKEAKRLFQTEGYKQISMRRIAKEIGCAPMTLYKYYDAKIAILRTLWGSVFNDLFNALDEIKFNDKAPRRWLSELSLGYVNYWIEHQDHYRLVFMSEGVMQPDVSIFINNTEIVARFQIFSKSLMALHDNQLNPDALKCKLDALICFLHGIAHNKITMSGYQWSHIDDLVAIAIQGVADS